MIDPTKVHNTVIEFVDRIIKSLEKEKLIKKIQIFGKNLKIALDLSLYYRDTKEKIRIT